MSTGRRTVTVTRSGGFAGMRAEHTVDLETVDTQQAEAWRRLLADDVLRLLPRAERPRPDGYVYRLVCEADDLDVTLERLAEIGIEPEKPPYTVREGGSRLCFVRDPDGYRIELIEHK